MDIAVSQALSLIEHELVKKDRDIMGANTSRDIAIKQLYELRLFIEGEQKKKVPFDAILMAVLTKLKALTPHGPENKVDL